jgi:hypothetical protein
MPSAGPPWTMVLLHISYYLNFPKNVEPFLLALLQVETELEFLNNLWGLGTEEE